MRNLTDVILFAWERHNAFRGYGVNDPIIRSKKFTNVHRLLDRGTQYLLHLNDQLYYNSDRMALSWLYRNVNLPHSMDLIIEHNNGEIPGFNQVTDPDWVNTVVGGAVKANREQGPFCSGAYMILVMQHSRLPFTQKLAQACQLVRPHLIEACVADTLEDKFRALHRAKYLGPFLTMQILTDVGYTSGNKYRENDFIVAGPGSRRGIRLVSDKQPREFLESFPTEELPPLPWSNGRQASLMDVQNLMCEFYKYHRYQQTIPPEELYKLPPYVRKGSYAIKIPKQHRLT